MCLNLIKFIPRIDRETLYLDFKYGEENYVTHCMCPNGLRRYINPNTSKKERAIQLTGDEDVSEFKRFVF